MTNTEQDYSPDAEPSKVEITPEHNAALFHALMSITTDAYVNQRNEQYRKLTMSKNTPKTFKVQTLDEKTNEWVNRMDSVSEAYLDSVGRRWVNGKFCVAYRVVAK